MARKILIIAAHSDDEALGCAGTMARHVAEGSDVHVIFMTDGVASRGLDSTIKSERSSSAQQVASLIGVTSMHNYDFPDNEMDSVSLLDITQCIESVIHKIQPNVIYTHHHGDLNIDHRITHQSVMTACRPQPESCVKEIYAFEVLSSTEWQAPGIQNFMPNVFVDITPYIEVKKKVLEAYGEEMREPPHTRSIENSLRLSALRGNSVGFEYSEAFELIRMLK